MLILIFINNFNFPIFSKITIFVLSVFKDLINKRSKLVFNRNMHEKNFKPTVCLVFQFPGSEKSLQNASCLPIFRRRIKYFTIAPFQFYKVLYSGQVSITFE